MPSSAMRAATFESLDLHCETCGGAATAMVQDWIRKTAPSGGLEYERDGEAHLLCRSHQRGPRFRDVQAAAVPVETRRRIQVRTPPPKLPG